MLEATRLKGTGWQLFPLRLLADIQMNHLPFCFRLGNGKVSEADGGEPRVMSVSETGIGQVRCLRRGSRSLEGISLGRPSRGGQQRRCLRPAKDNKLHPCTPHARMSLETRDLDDNFIFLKTKILLSNQFDCDPDEQLYVSC